MRFFSNVKDMPHAIFKEFEDYDGIKKREHIATFQKGIFETDDERIIGLLQARPDLFKWEVEQKHELPVDMTYRDIVKKAKSLGIKVSQRKKLDLLKEINEKEVMSYEIS